MADVPFVTLSAGGLQSSSSPSSSASSDSSLPLDSTPVSSVSSITHDTSRTKYHMNELNTFVKRLEDSATCVFPNRGRSQYKEVRVLLMRWEEDGMGVQLELDDLAKVFRDHYGFITETWLIPVADPHMEVMGKCFTMVQEHGKAGNLLILYYAGHGFMNPSRQPLWTCTSNPRYASVQWYAIQTLFEQSKSDVLLLLDCCAAASSAPADGHCRNVTETIAACGFETWAPQPGRHSFTNTLIEVLEDWQYSSPFTAAMLHCEILNRLRHEKPERRRDVKNFEFRRTPIHVFSTCDPKARSVELCARGCSADTTDAEMGTPYSPTRLTEINASGGTLLPHVLISLALEEEQLLDIEDCRKWLQQFPALAIYAKVEGVYKSNSTLLILSVPVVIWDGLPDDLACAFIGYVHSTNMMEVLQVQHTRSMAAQKDRLNVNLEIAGPSQTTAPSVFGNSAAVETHYASSIYSVDSTAPSLSGGSTVSSSSSRSSQSLAAQNMMNAARPLVSNRGDNHFIDRRNMLPFMSRLESKAVSLRKTPLSKPILPRPRPNRVFCKECFDHPEGFRGEHELRRHQDRAHTPSLIKKWVCIEPTDNGDHPKPVVPLSGCKACTNQKKNYGAYYNAAAHLRRAHFRPKPSRGRSKTALDAKNGGGEAKRDWPPMAELKNWMKEVEIPMNDSSLTTAQQQEADESDEGLFDLSEQVMSSMDFSSSSFDTPYTFSHAPFDFYPSMNNMPAIVDSRHSFSFLEATGTNPSISDDIPKMYFERHPNLDL